MLDKASVLFTSVGRRGYLLDWFRASGLFDRIIAVNSEPCTAFAHADSWEVLPATASEDFEKKFFDTVEKFDVGLVVPLTDIDSFVISHFAPTLSQRGVFFLGSDRNNVEQMIDKASWPEYLSNLGFPVARSFRNVDAASEAILAGVIAFPLMLKPRVGTSSNNLRIVQNMSELVEGYVALCKTAEPNPLEKLIGVPGNERFIVQEFFSGLEYGFDLLADFSGNFEGFLSRQKLSMRSGETDIAITTAEAPGTFSVQKLSEALGVIGVADVDLMKSSEEATAIIDINPRIGGGYPFSHIAGADLPGWVWAWMRGERVAISQSALGGKRVGKEISLVEIPT